MAVNKLQLKRSAVPGKVPTTSSLDLGELAINTFDGKVFLKKDNGVQSIVEIGSGGGGTGTGFPFTGSAFISGSLIITGSATATQGFTGSLFGTASWAINALSASYFSGSVSNAISSSYALSASFAEGSMNTQDVLIYVKNTTGQQIDKGKVVRISGATGDNALIALADWTDDANSANTLGLTNQDIPDQAFGYVMTEGKLLGIDTSLYTAGQLLFLASSGSMTGSAPLAPLHGVRLGQVLRVQGINGSMYVRIDNGYELDELHDVRITSPTTGQSLVRSGSIWTNGNPISSSYALSSSYAGLSNIQYVTSSIETLSQIEVLDYSTEVAVTFVDGRLKLIFGTPATHSITSFSFNSTFNTDRFNRVLDDYTASAVWSNNGYTLISASIFTGSVLLAQTGTGTTLNYTTITSGSFVYNLQVTASNPADGTILVRSASLTGALSKTNPGNPTVTPTATVQLGATSNQIEQGATGSITFTTASGASNGWTFNFLTSSIASPLNVTGSLTGSVSIIIAATASYSSSGVNGSDNSPALTASVFGTSTFTKIRSLRSGAIVSASLTQANIEHIGAWDTTIGGSVGVIQKGTTTATGQSVTINWTGDKYHYIVYNGSLSFLTNITSAGFGVLSLFTSSSVGDYKVYRTNLLQAGGAGNSITYVLT